MYVWQARQSLFWPATRRIAREFIRNSSFRLRCMSPPSPGEDHIFPLVNWDKERIPMGRQKSNFKHSSIKLCMQMYWKSELIKAALQHVQKKDICRDKLFGRGHLRGLCCSLNRVCLSLSASDDLKSMRLKRATLLCIFSAKHCCLHDGVPLKRMLKSTPNEILSAISIGFPWEITKELSNRGSLVTFIAVQPMGTRCHWISDERTEDPRAAYAKTPLKKFPNIFVVISDANKFIHCCFCAQRPSFTCRWDSEWQYDLLFMHFKSFQMNT